MSRKDSAKELILNQAVQMASVAGLNGLTIGSLAEAVAMSKGGISAHFKSKIDLQVATVERAAELFHAAVLSNVLAEPAGIARLYKLCDSWFGFLQQGVFLGGCFLTNAVLELDDLADSEVRAAVLHDYQDYLNFIEQCIGETVELGQFRANTPIAALAFQFHGILIAALVWRAVRSHEAQFTTARAAIGNLIESYRS
ncbi:TetR/AcrR family transcriptional regulator [Herpetosiphon sp. NSE202]|uniref:TetR/AcrR family transcriptional regulator n=1 Tax=Herpetosiphon sp. NSE202 TaxID=3351349 RepID=UPI00362D5C79